LEVNALRVAEVGSTGAELLQKNAAGLNVDALAFAAADAWETAEEPKLTIFGAEVLETATPKEKPAVDALVSAEVDAWEGVKEPKLNPVGVEGVLAIPKLYPVVFGAAEAEFLEAFRKAANGPDLALSIVRLPLLTEN
jgi:hypothetical protein